MIDFTALVNELELSASAGASNSSIPEAAKLEFDMF
jgi:hypothetical protein